MKMLHSIKSKQATFVGVACFKYMTNVRLWY